MNSYNPYEEERKTKFNTKKGTPNDEFEEF